MGVFPSGGCTGWLSGARRPWDQPPSCASSTHSLPAPGRPAPPRPVGQQSPHWPTPQVYVLKRPHVDEFLQRMGELFECVLFTASLAKVSPPLSEGLLGHLCFLSASSARPLGSDLWVALGPG